MSFSVSRGVSGPVQSLPPAASCSHPQCAWAYQSRQPPRCWSRSTVIRPSGTSTSTVGRVRANGNATYSASFSSVAALVMRFSTSSHGNSSYNVTTDVTSPAPSTLRCTTSCTPIPGSRSRRADTSCAWLTVRSGAARRNSRDGSVQSALCRPPRTYTSWFSPPPDQPVGRTRSEEHTSELQSLAYLVCRLLLEKK